MNFVDLHSAKIDEQEMIEVFDSSFDYIDV